MTHRTIQGGAAVKPSGRRGTSTQRSPSACCAESSPARTKTRVRKKAHHERYIRRRRAGTLSDHPAPATSLTPRTHPRCRPTLSLPASSGCPLPLPGRVENPRLIFRATFFSRVPDPTVNPSQEQTGTNDLNSARGTNGRNHPKAPRRNPQQSQQAGRSSRAHRPPCERLHAPRERRPSPCPGAG